ncbi:MAG: hypothetical protein H0T86_09060 [Gemmatimonadales bacterium]|nr:hypothetical protein [Gemmatimonadales bacterium]
MPAVPPSSSSRAPEVENLDDVLDALRAEGCAVDDRIESSEYGRLGWVTDPEGNRLELWEPPPQPKHAEIDR